MIGYTEARKNIEYKFASGDVIPATKTVITIEEWESIKRYIKGLEDELGLNE